MISRKIIGSAVTDEDLNALNYLASKYVQLNEDITLSKNTIVGKYASYYLDSTVNEDYSGDCILHYSTSLSDVTFILSLEWINSQGETFTTTTIGENGVITVYAPSGYTRFNNVGTITIRNGKYSEESSLPASILSFSASATTINVGETVTFTGTLTNEDLEPLANESISIYRNNIYLVTLTTSSDGSFSYTPFRQTISNTYQFKAVFAGNESYEGSQSIITITVNKINTNLVIDVPLVLVYTDDFNITGTLKTSSNTAINNATVKLKVGSTVVDTKTTNSSGVVSFTQTPVHMGTHTFQLVYDGDNTYLNAESSAVTREIGKETSVLTLTSPLNNSSYYTDETISVTGTLLSNDSEAISGKTIVVYDGNTSIKTLTTDSNGAFSGSLTGLSAASHTLKFKFVEDSYYTGSEVSRSVTVQEHSYVLSASASSTSITEGQSITVSGSLLKDGVAYGSQTVTLHIQPSVGGPSTQTATTGNDGSYSFTVSNLVTGDSPYTIFATALDGAAETEDIVVTVSLQPTPASLVVTGTKNILSYADSESSVLTATVKDSSNNPVSGQSVVFKKGSTTLDTKVTDVNGQCSYTYASAGAGDVTLTVECSLLQEIFVIEDCWYYDTNTYNKATYPDGNGYMRSVTLDKTLPSVPFTLEFIIKQTDTSSSVPYLDIGASTNNRMLVGQYARAGGNGLIVYKSSSTTHAYGTNPTVNTDNTIWFKADGTKYYYKLNNGSVMEVTDANVTLSKLIHIESGNGGTLSNIKVKPL